MTGNAYALTTPSVYALLRVSTEEQSIDRQAQAAAAWARSQGFALVDAPELREEGVSGAARKRPGLEYLLRHVKAGDAVWVSELSRIGRSLVQVVDVLSRLDGMGVRVIVANAGIDYGSPAGRLQAQMIAAFAEFEREMIRERTRDGLAAARRRGVRLGKRPDRWCDEGLAALRGMMRAGHSPYAIWRSRLITVWRPVKDAKTGKWTEKPVTPGQTAIYQKVAELEAEGLSD